MHAIGDAGNRAVLDAFEAAFKAHPEKKDVRFRDEHSQILDEKDIPRFGQLGVIASIQGIHGTSDLPWASQRLGEARVLEGAYVWQKLKKSGAILINGTDAPVEDVDPIRNFYASVTRQSETGVPPGGYQPDQKLTRLEALQSYTKDAYWASFAEANGGTIAPGKWADLTVLSKDILSVPDAEILKTQILYTIVNGKVAYRQGSLEIAGLRSGVMASTTGPRRKVTAFPTERGKPGPPGEPSGRRSRDRSVAQTLEHRGSGGRRDRVDRPAAHGEPQAAGSGRPVGSGESPLSHVVPAQKPRDHGVRSGDASLACRGLGSDPRAQGAGPRGVRL